MAWWQERVIYQIVVPSFCDTNGDGYGDLAGIIQKLDYLQWLGVGAIWLSPIHPSPLVDLGYDVSDYRDVHPLFGTLDDFGDLVDEAHRRDIKIILDWVPNHTSDEHPWFLQSRSSRDNPQRDWYLWRDPQPDGSLPNNWISIFGGSTWTWDEHTGQYYCHMFDEKQPCLNWRNPEVKAAIFDAMRFWLARGVDGYRLDATAYMFKDPKFRDNPPNPNYKAGLMFHDQVQLHTYTYNLPEVHTLVAEMRQLVDEYDDRFLAGELYLAPQDIAAYYGTPEWPELHMPFNLTCCCSSWRSAELIYKINEYRAALPPHGWPTWTFGTHDCPRLAGCCLPPKTRLAALLLLTLPGTPTMYYGDEIGMVGVPIPPEKSRDPQGRRIGRNREPARTPMQWSRGPQAGFSTGTPWLPVANDLHEISVERQRRDERSLLSLYQKLLTLRKQEHALRAGAMERVEHREPCLVYECVLDQRRLLVALNFEYLPQTVDLSDRGHGRLLLSTQLDRAGEDLSSGPLSLRGYEGVIVELTA